MNVNQAELSADPGFPDLIYDIGFITFYYYEASAGEDVDHSVRVRAVKAEPYFDQYLNLNEEEWFNVVTNESMGKDSFFDLFDKAYIDLAHILQTIDDVYYNDLDYEPINEFIGQINHDGIKVGQKMKYYSIIFKK